MHIPALAIAVARGRFQPVATKAVIGEDEQIHRTTARDAIIPAAIIGRIPR